MSEVSILALAASIKPVWDGLSDDEKNELHLTAATDPGKDLRGLSFADKIVNLVNSNGCLESVTASAIEVLATEWHLKSGRLDEATARGPDDTRQDPKIDDTPKWWKTYVSDNDDDLGCTLCGSKPVVVWSEGKAATIGWKMGAGYCPRCAVNRFKISESEFSLKPLKRKATANVFKEEVVKRDKHLAEEDEKIQEIYREWMDKLIASEAAEDREKAHSTAAEETQEELRSRSPVERAEHEAESFVRKHIKDRDVFSLRSTCKENQHLATHLRYESKRSK